MLLSGSAAGHPVTAAARVTTSGGTSCGIVSGGLTKGIVSGGRVAGTDATGLIAGALNTGTAEYGAPNSGTAYSGTPEYADVSLGWGVMIHEKKKKVDTTQIHAKEQFFFTTLFLETERSCPW
jgi:hypothetical protein